MFSLFGALVLSIVWDNLVILQVLLILNLSIRPVVLVFLLGNERNLTDNYRQSVSQKEKKICVLHELGNIKQVGVWGPVSLSVESVGDQRQNVSKTFNI